MPAALDRRRNDAPEPPCRHGWRACGPSARLPDPASVLTLPRSELRRIGFSHRKAETILELQRRRGQESWSSRRLKGSTMTRSSTLSSDNPGSDRGARTMSCFADWAASRYSSGPTSAPSTASAASSRPRVATRSRRGTHPLEPRRRSRSLPSPASWTGAILGAGAFPLLE